ncbi:MFS transporter [Xylogone sp. PMI_703]|nr:MFS transporter [Xylogone sp. PMI_703]
MEESKPKFTVAWINIICAIFSCLGAFIFGFDSGIFNTTIAHQTFNIYMFHNTTGNAILTGAVASTYTAGTAIGGLFSGWSAERFGRKKTIIVAAAVVAIGTAIQTAAQNVGMLIAGRVIAGLAVGVLLSIVPVYNAELAVPQYRGIIVGLFGVMASFGVVCSNWIGYACQFAHGDAQWRIPLGCQIPTATVLCIGAFFLPESPRWLIEKDRSQEAHTIMMRIHGGLGENYVAREFTQMHEQIVAETAARKSSWIDTIATPSARKRLYLGIFVNIFNNLGGTPVISVYQSKLFQEIGFRGTKTLLLSGFYGLAGFAGVITNITLVADRLGRKTSMWMGAIVIVIDLVILMPLTKIYTGSDNMAGKAAAVTFIFLHSYPYSVFMYGTVWVYTTEIFPTHLRAKGTAICTFWGQAFGILLQQIGLKVFEDIGYLFYIVFIVCTSFAGVIYYLFLPETKGATLEDISRFFGDPVVASFNEDKSRIARVLNEVDGFVDPDHDGDRDGQGKDVVVQHVERQ